VRPVLRNGGLAAAAMLLLAASADAAPTRHMINRVNVLEPLVAGGTEPFWDIVITGRSVTWSDPETENRTGLVGAPRLSHGKAVWKGEASGVGPFTMTVTRGPCEDGMSEFIYPLTVRVRSADWTLNGCAATLAAIERRDREGREDGELR
jgi:uncharacterized membrane protein